LRDDDHSVEFAIVLPNGSQRVEGEE